MALFYLNQLFFSFSVLSHSVRACVPLCLSLSLSYLYLFLPLSLSLTHMHPTDGDVAEGGAAGDESRLDEELVGDDERLA